MERGIDAGIKVLMQINLWLIVTKMSFSLLPRIKAIVSSAWPVHYYYGENYLIFYATTFGKLLLSNLQYKLH